MPSTSVLIIGDIVPRRRPGGYRTYRAGAPGRYRAVHELGITQALIEQVEEVRSRHEGRAVISVGVRIGSWRLVVPESLEFYYTLLTRDTPLAGSRLEIESVEARGRCSRCGETFPVEAPLIVCPVCGGLGGDLICGQELDLVSVELTD